MNFDDDVDFRFCLPLALEYLRSRRRDPLSGSMENTAGKTKSTERD